MIDDWSASRERALPGALVRRGRALLNQQCWLWGRDVLCSRGNLLCAFGFTRLRAPQGVPASSQYTLERPDGVRVRLWGFGLYFGGLEGIYLNRFAFTPKRAPFRPDWQSREEMEALPPCRDLLLLTRAAAWVAEYERWILREAGSPHREEALRSWKHAVSGPAGVAASWERLADDLGALSASTTARYGPGSRQPAPDGNAARPSTLSTACYLASPPPSRIWEPHSRMPFEIRLAATLKPAINASKTPLLPAYLSER